MVRHEDDVGEAVQSESTLSTMSSLSPPPNSKVDTLSEMCDCIDEDISNGKGEHLLLDKEPHIDSVSHPLLSLSPPSDSEADNCSEFLDRLAESDGYLAIVEKAAVESDRDCGI
ncbi:hypothetical protein V9T40_003395 [Parthenolecanium corni]|uniref:Uncharacterized protein n=1 Tax=Parthenolecanium corni TaxID=536013 RepID=A0AAN9Y8U2_9HEMI